MAPEVYAWLRQHTRARHHDGVHQRRCGRGRLISGQAAVHVGDALGGKRVAAQPGPAAVVVQAVGCLQLVKHRDKALRRKAGGLHQREADAIGLALHVAREVELRLRGQRLPAHHQRLPGIGAVPGDDGAQDQRAHHQRRHAFVLRNQARDVALRDVAEFVRQHGCQLVWRIDHRQQPELQAEEAARQRKGIDRAVADQEDFPGEALMHLRRHFAARQRRLDEPIQNALRIFLNGRVLHVAGVAVDLCHDALTELALARQRHLVAIAHRRQPLGHGERRNDACNNYQNKSCQRSSVLRNHHFSLHIFHTRPRRLRPPYDACSH